MATNDIYAFVERSDGVLQPIQINPLPAVMIDPVAFASLAQGTKADSALQTQTQSDWNQASSGSTDFIKNKPTIASRVFTNNASRTIQTVAAAGNGVQLSSTRDSFVSYSASISTSATIGGAATGYIVLEVCATNSTTAGSWQEVARLSNSQTITLAVALQSIQVITGNLVAMVPAGYYERLRSFQSSGTPTFAYVSGQEVLL